MLSHCICSNFNNLRFAFIRSFRHSFFFRHHVLLTRIARQFVWVFQGTVVLEHPFNCSALQPVRKFVVFSVSIVPRRAHAGSAAKTSCQLLLPSIAVRCSAMPLMLFPLLFTLTNVAPFRILHASVALRHPYAAAFLEGSLVCLHSFLYLPRFFVSKALQMLGSLWKTRLMSFRLLERLFSLCCRVDNRLTPPMVQSELSLHSQEWSDLRVSAKSAYLSEHEANNSIVHVALSLLQSSCSPQDLSHMTAACHEACNSCTWCIFPSNTRYSHFSSDESIKISLQSSLLLQQQSKIVDPHARQMLRAQLHGTRAQLRSMQSPLQQETHGFDSWSHVLISMNPFSRADIPSSAKSLSDDSDVVIQRRALHKRMCRINKWHLLLRLHHMPWLRLLRRHALVHPPSQPHLAWRSSTLLLSSNMLQAAAAAVSFQMQILQNPSHQAQSDVDSFEQRILALQAIVDLHSRMFASLQSERISLRASGQERTLGCGCCCTLPCAKGSQLAIARRNPKTGGLPADQPVSFGGAVVTV